MVLSGLVGGCGSGWVRRVPGDLLVCSSSGCAVRAVPETAWARLPGASAHRRPQLVAVGGLVPGDAGPRLFCRCARASGWAEAPWRTAPGQPRGRATTRTRVRVRSRTAPGQPRGRARASDRVEVNALWGR